MMLIAFVDFFALKYRQAKRKCKFRVLSLGFKVFLIQIFSDTFNYLFGYQLYYYPDCRQAGISCGCVAHFNDINMDEHMQLTK